MFSYITKGPPPSLSCPTRQFLPASLAREHLLSSSSTLLLENNYLKAIGNPNIGAGSNHLLEPASELRSRASYSSF